MTIRKLSLDKLQSLNGKTIATIHLYAGHGDVLELKFTDGTTLGVCTTYGLSDESVEPNRNDLYLTINDESLATYACPTNN